jgi:hypothetical protein
VSDSSQQAIPSTVNELVVNITESTVAFIQQIRRMGDFTNTEMMWFRMHSEECFGEEMYQLYWRKNPRHGYAVYGEGFEKAVEQRLEKHSYEELYRFARILVAIDDFCLHIAEGA